MYKGSLGGVWAPREQKMMVVCMEDVVKAPKGHKIFIWWKARKGMKIVYYRYSLIWKISILEAHLLPMFMVPLVNHCDLYLGWDCSSFEM